MGRRPRIEYYGAIYHIIQQGNHRNPVFKDAKDKLYLLELLNEAKTIYDFKVYAYIIMDNYCHFLIQTFNIPISKIMHNINTKYAKYYNFKMNKTGSVFKERYTSVLVQDESYLLNIIRYIHNNPVAVKICNSMEEYKWSSDVFYRMNIRNIVDIDVLLNILSLDRKKSLEIYVELMDEKISDYKALKDIYERSSIIGSHKFISSFERTDKDEKTSLDIILEMSCPTKDEFNLIKTGSRKRYLTKYKLKYIQLGRKEGYSYRQIGKNIGVSGTSIRNILKG